MLSYRRASVIIAYIALPVLLALFIKDIQKTKYASTLHELAASNKGMVQTIDSLLDAMGNGCIQPMQKALAGLPQLEQSIESMCALDIDKSAAFWCSTSLVDTFRPAVARADARISEALGKYQSFQRTLEEHKVIMLEFTNTTKLDEELSIVGELASKFSVELERFKGEFEVSSTLNEVTCGLANPWGARLP